MKKHMGTENVNSTLHLFTCSNATDKHKLSLMFLGKTVTAKGFIKHVTLHLLP